MTLTTSSPSKPLRDAITKAYRSDETDCITALLAQVTFTPDALLRITTMATQWVNETRKCYKKQGGIDTLLHEYDLSSEEGVALLCLAEALLRIPDTATIDRFISDKISAANESWHTHFSNHSLFLNAATWSLLLTGKIFKLTRNTEKSLVSSLQRLLGRAGGVLIRPMILQGMKSIGQKFIIGTNITEALTNSKIGEKQGYRYSYDMLGEAARTMDTAEKYFKAYQEAIIAIGKSQPLGENRDPIKGPGISIKLSALHPRYEFAQRERVLRELVPRVLQLAEAAKAYNIGLTIDAEEADRLDISLDIIESVFCHPVLDHWEGFGVAVQSYQKRAPFVIDWLADLAHRQGKRCMVRLIKGAYWDSEIKTSQVLGLEGYPVFTRKQSTDISFIACAKKILAYPDRFYPQFGTHNAYSVAAILEMAGENIDFEFQCLHGMGELLYNQLITKIPCRIYAPVGGHKDLLGYLVRRLLENGANTSFINRLADEKIPVETIVAHPMNFVEKQVSKPHSSIPLPKDSYKPERLNSMGLDLTNQEAVNNLRKSIALIETDSKKNIDYTTPEHIEKKIQQAADASAIWANTPVSIRAACLERAADLFEKNRPLLIHVLCREGRKQIADCISEIREAVDFCRYYACCARRDLQPQLLKGPTGESNQFSLHPRGIILCISPWNFPLAIFIGQIVAALVTGNAVIAKPAEQTPLIASEAIKILHTAGVPEAVLQLVIGKSSQIGRLLVADARIAGVMLTGSTETARSIQQTLTNRPGAIVPLIAETGGQNTMIVDSSALPEQVVVDVIQSAFNSAGQRCSALRVLFIQEDTADTFLTMLKGAMAELVIGDPSLLSTDIGPVIDQKALDALQKHFIKMQTDAVLVYQIPLGVMPTGHFFAPCVFEIKNLNQLEGEVFGPILHVIRYPEKELPKILEDIRQTGYGLTLGIHSRINATVTKIIDYMRVGNIYVNRNMIGAVVGVQPFGGEGLSGTGPKAGGPYYLPRLCVERVTSINTSAVGGNTVLLSLSEEDIAI